MQTCDPLLPQPPRLESLHGALIASLIHEMRSPLTAVSALGQILASTSGASSGALEKLHASAEDMAQLLRQAEFFIHNPEQAPRVDLTSALKEEAAAWHSAFSGKNVALTVELEDQIFISLTQDSLKGALYLIFKALYFSIKGTWPFTIRIKKSEEIDILIGQFSDEAYAPCSKSFINRAAIPEGGLALAAARYIFEMAGIELKFYSSSSGSMLCSTLHPSIYLRSKRGALL